MTSFQVQQWLRQGIAAAKSGELERARELLLQVVDADEYNEQGWIWLSSVVETDEDREICLENVLAINPENRLAKSGLAHLRERRRAVAAPPVEPEPEPEPPPPAPGPAMKAMPADWWNQPQPAEPAPADLLEDRLSTAAAPARPPFRPPAAPVAAPAVEQAVEQAETPRPKKERRRRKISLRPVAIALCLVLGLSAAAVAALALLKVGPFNPGDQTFIQAMRPLLEEYDQWWAGPYGTLTGELNSLCGSDADGWTHLDVLVACSQQPAVDCGLLAAHCAGDVEAMRAQIVVLASQAQTAGDALLQDLHAVIPPDDVAVAHRHFVACVEAQVAAAGRAGELARGNAPGNAVPIPICQMFPTAEQEVRAYVEGR